MKRRTLVASLGSALLGGCGDQLRTPSSSRTSPIASPAPRTTTRTRTTWTRTTAHGTPLPERDLSRGEWYEWNDWNITVESLSRSEAVRDEYENTTHDLPADEQLVVATVRLEEAGWPGTWYAGTLAIIVDGTEVYEPLFRIDLPEVEEKHISVLPEVEHARQFWTAGYSIDADEPGTVWLVAIVPRDAGSAAIEIGLEAPIGYDGYPVRWAPEAATTEP